MARETILLLAIATPSHRQYQAAAAIHTSTVDTNRHKKGFIKTSYEIFGGKSSVHNCYGLGQDQCVTDGYRKEGDLQMHKEHTIFDLMNQGK